MPEDLRVRITNRSRTRRESVPRTQEERARCRGGDGTPETVGGGPEWAAGSRDGSDAARMVAVRPTFTFTTTGIKNPMRQKESGRRRQMRAAGMRWGACGGQEAFCRRRRVAEGARRAPGSLMETPLEVVRSFFGPAWLCCR